MKTKILIAAAFAVVGATFAYAAADDTITARQNCMKAQGGFMGVAVPMVKAEKPYDRAALDVAWAKQGEACKDWANFWGADTQTGTGVVSYAKPEIWTDAKGFEAASTAAYTAMVALKATTDEAGFKAAFGAVGKSCQDCHKSFRAPKP